MAVTLGTSSGFVSSAPTNDPAGGNTTIDGSAGVTNDTSPTTAKRIVEIGWYRGGGTGTTNWELGLYAADGATVPGEAGTRLFVADTNSSSSGGWLKATVNWTISPSTSYWLGLQMDAHAGSSTVDSNTSSGTGIDIRTSQTTLPNPFGGGALADANGMYAIYALWTTGDVSVFDPVTITEDINLYITELFVSVSDLVTVTEDIVLSIPLPVDVFDSVTVTESINLYIAELFVSVSDLVTVTEYIVLEIPVEQPTCNVFDSVTITEDINLYITELFVSVSDLITVTEDLNIFEIYYLSIGLNIKEGVKINDF
jgi:hypothetical protein